MKNEKINLENWREQIKAGSFGKPHKILVTWNKKALIGIIKSLLAANHLEASKTVKLEAIKEILELEAICTCGCNFRDGCLCKEKQLGFEICQGMCIKLLNP